MGRPRQRRRRASGERSRRWSSMACAPGNADWFCARSCFVCAHSPRNLVRHLRRARRPRDWRRIFRSRTTCPRLVTGDRVRLRAALENLIDNAVKFTERGRVAMTVSGQRPGAPPQADICRDRQRQWNCTEEKSPSCFGHSPKRTPASRAAMAARDWGLPSCAGWLPRWAARSRSTAARDAAARLRSRWRSRPCRTAGL